MTNEVEQVSELERLRQVMDRLRSPGGCPWDAEQDHRSLLKYLLEESYEYIEAVEDDDREAMREELGDVLLQVFFHARMAEEDPHDPFTVEEVAKGVADKLVRRHPHVFGDVKVETSEEVLENWEALKAAEKGRQSAIDGIPLNQPALARAEKIIYRLKKFNLPIDVSNQVELPANLNGEEFGELLLGLVAWASENGIDAEASLRGATKELIADITAYESTQQRNSGE